MDTDTLLIPAWSQDGQHIGVTTYGSKSISIRLYRADGTGERKLPLVTFKGVTMKQNVAGSKKG